MTKICLVDLYKIPRSGSVQAIIYLLPEKERFFRKMKMQITIEERGRLENSAG